MVIVYYDNKDQYYTDLTDTKRSKTSKRKTQHTFYHYIPVYIHVHAIASVHGIQKITVSFEEPWRGRKKHPYWSLVLG